MTTKPARVIMPPAIAASVAWAVDASKVRPASGRCRSQRGSVHPSNAPAATRTTATAWLRFRRARCVPRLRKAGRARTEPVIRRAQRSGEGRSRTGPPHRSRRGEGTCPAVRSPASSVPGVATGTSSIGRRGSRREPPETTRVKRARPARAVSSYGVHPVVRCRGAGESGTGPRAPSCAHVVASPASRMPLRGRCRCRRTRSPSPRSRCSPRPTGRSRPPAPREHAAGLPDNPAVPRPGFAAVTL